MISCDFPILDAVSLRALDRLEVLERRRRQGFAVNVVTDGWRATERRNLGLRVAGKMRELLDQPDDGSHGFYGPGHDLVRFMGGGRSDIYGYGLCAGERRRQLDQRLSARPDEATLDAMAISAIVHRSAARRALGWVGTRGGGVVAAPRLPRRRGRRWMSGEMRPSVFAWALEAIRAEPEEESWW